MGTDDRVEELAASVLDGSPIDWDVATADTVDSGEEATYRAMQDLERIALYSRSAQKHSEPRTVPLPEQWGHLTLLEVASAGSSGEIWRAWDSWLQREVALKFLLTTGDHGTDDSALLEEARALARVRHPGVVAVYGIGEHAGRIGMWMELLLGNTLEVEVARRGSLPAEEVARIGYDLCRSLEAVGAAGLVHRDIKPSNIVLESTGRIVLTDFGLGRRLSFFDSQPWRSSGTPLFMSPERLAGEPATPRSDLYALGVTLRWALTGRCPFRARTVEELKTEANQGPSERLGAERPDAPALLVDSIERAMAPQVESRYTSAADLASDLGRVLAGKGTSAAVGARWRRWIPVAAALALVGAAAFLALEIGRRSTSPQPARFTLTPPPRSSFLAGGQQDLAISPDGRLLAFTAVDSTGVARLWVRSVDSLTPRLLEGTENAVGPFWSPDSRTLAFFANSKLHKISVSGGAPEVLCAAYDPRGGAWGDGVIVFAPTVAGPLCRVSAEGGAVTEILRPDSARGETAFRWPQFLPDGKRFFFVALPPGDKGFDVFVGSIESKGRRRVMSAGCAPICAGNEGIILADNGRLMFQKFDYRRLRPVGAPVALGIAPFADVSVGQPLATASENGVLVHASENLIHTRLNWLDRSGNRTGTVALPEGRYERVFFSPDGRRLLVDRRDSPTTMDLWILDLDREQTRRFSQSSQSRLGGAPVWSPDGARIAFNSNRSGKTYIYERLVNEAGEERLLYQGRGQFNEVIDWSPDGNYLVFQTAAPETGWDLWLLPLSGNRVPIPYIRTRAHELGSSISPDGRWLAYSTETRGTPEIHVRAFPNPGAEHVVYNGPGGPIWGRQGGELFIFDRGVISVPVDTGPPFRSGPPRRLFQSRPGGLWLTSAPDGHRFIEIRPAEDVEPTQITVDLNFLARISR